MNYFSFEKAYLWRFTADEISIKNCDSCDQEEHSDLLFLLITVANTKRLPIREYCAVAIA